MNDAPSKNFNEERYADSRNDPAEFRKSQRLRQVLDLLGPLRGGRLLDVGCMDGFLSVLFRDEGFHVIGVDASPTAIAGAKERGLEAYVGDFDKPPLPLPDGAVDVVFAGEVLEHIFRTEEFLEELARVTKPGGHLVLTTPNLACWLNRIVLLFGWQPFFSEVGTRASHCGNPLRSGSAESAGHIRLFTLSSLRDLLGRCGWEVIDFRGAGLMENRFARPVDRTLSKWVPALASDLIMFCRKK
jgi:2-polyprenyl-3-methyl-5-hydroxy-6-metoxy-1,4-benzoquinol methylase